MDQDDSVGVPDRMPPVARRIVVPPRRTVQRIRRTVAGAAALLIAVVAMSAFFIWRGQAQQRESLTTRFDTRQATAARFVEAYVGGVFRRETELASRSFQDTPTGSAFVQTAGDQGYDAAVLLDDQGHLLASQPSKPSALGKDLTVKYVHLRSAVRGAPAVSGVVPSAVRGVPVVAFAVPFQTPSGRRVFSGAYSVESTPLAPFVRNATPFRSAKVLIVDASGRVVAGSITGAAGQSLAEVSPSLVQTKHAGYVGVGQDRQYFTQSPIEGSTWRMMFAIDTDELFGQVSATARLAPWLALAGMGLLGLLTLAVVYRYMLQRARLQETESRQRAVLNAAGEAFIGMDETGRITDWNASATRLLGWTEDEALNHLVVDLIVPPEDRAAHTAAISKFLETGVTSLPATPVRVQALTKDGQRADVEFSPSRLPSEAGWHFHAFLRDISGQLEHERQLRDLALTDALTGLQNRRAILERLDQALARADRRDTPVAVLFIDVDHFKAVNDGHGHATGDELLKAVGTRLRSLVRVEDSVARLGGDEFLVVCEDLHSPAQAVDLADRTRATLAQPYDIAGRRLTATASVGLAVATNGVSAEVLLARADATMYDAKASKQAFTDIVSPRAVTLRATP